MLHRTKQVYLAIVVLAVCWFSMLAVHEMGHVLAALSTGGKVEKVVLYPLTISSTTISPNPKPGVVVWAGPLFGAFAPLILILCCRTDGKQTDLDTKTESGQPDSQTTDWRNLGVFFAGFCLIANGAYIGFGSLDQIGDCKQIFETGSPTWVMILFGAVTIPLGLCLWHRLGSIKQFFGQRHIVNQHMLISLTTILALLLAIEFLFSPR